MSGKREVPFRIVKLEIENRINWYMTALDLLKAGNKEAAAFYEWPPSTHTPSFEENRNYNLITSYEWRGALRELQDLAAWLKEMEIR